MTVKISKNQKKYNRLMSALDGTWNCDHPCSTCPFHIKSARGLAVIKGTDFVSESCAALAIRQIAQEMFIDDAKGTKNYGKVVKLW
jgi:hypothetical protein